MEFEVNARKSKKGYGFGTAPVFLAAISTILGAILFLRFGYAVGHAGLFGSILIIFIGHAITIPTAMAIAEISTNLKVEGGGEYFIISRSFGSMVGGTIGISLYFSQAISVAFYMIAFSEAFTPLFNWINSISEFTPHTWMVSIPATVILLLVIIRKGANLGVTALWIVVSILAISLIMFFLGGSSTSPSSFDIFNKVSDPDDFFKVFAIIFPAFTGMTAGVGLSGDLKNPRRSIPLGTLSATIFGMVVYIFIVFKLFYSLSPEQLTIDQFAMSKIALWGPIIPIGLAAATLSSAIGSILIAPRTMQALANDNIIPIKPINSFLAKGKGESNEPLNATIVTAIIVFIVVAMGNVDFVAQIISMFFMITYGSLCLVSFLEHFAGNPSYRPTFRSKWFLSLIGAVGSFIMMFQMAPLYAFIAVIAITVIYLIIKSGREGEDDLSSMVKGALFQLTRKLQVLIQRKQASVSEIGWRPSFIAISSTSLTRLAPFDLLRWISHYYGFGTFIHYIKGFLDENTNQEAKLKLDQLIKQSAASKAGIYVDTIISPSFRTAVAQIVQIPGISGMENNSILFEFHQDDKENITDIIDGCHFASLVDYNICVLRSSEHHFGYKQNIHIWLTPGDYRNANLMILIAYIIMGHPDWKECKIDLYAAFEEKELNKEMIRLNQLINKGRIPISNKNVKRVPWDKNVKTYETLVTENSNTADLVIMGFSVSKLSNEKGAFFKKFDNINEVLFVRAGQKIAISEALE
jgi:amino acid transporter